MEKELMAVLLAHAKYSFSNISWNFESLTSEEKDLVKSQEVLNRIKQLDAGGAEVRNGKAYSVEITDELESESPKEALQDTLDRLKFEETVAVVTRLETGEVFHIECQTGEYLKDFGV